jgi:hypothetical protein
MRTAKTVRAKKIANHVANFARLKALYDETPDGRVEAVCYDLEAEEDWLQAQLRCCSHHLGAPLGSQIVRF